jgi:transcriptional regulator with XRE-family HTH domain
MKTLSNYSKKLPAAERTAIAEGARRKINSLRLQQVREAAGLTQEQVAQRMGVTQASLSRLEHRSDVKLSNIRKYIEAVGGRLEVSVVMPKRATRRAGTAGKERKGSDSRPAGRRISLVSASRCRPEL